VKRNRNTLCYSEKASRVGQIQIAGGESSFETETLEEKRRKKDVKTKQEGVKREKRYLESGGRIRKGEDRDLIWYKGIRKGKREFNNVREGGRGEITVGAKGNHFSNARTFNKEEQKK